MRQTSDDPYYGIFVGGLIAGSLSLPTAIAGVVFGQTLVYAGVCLLVVSVVAVFGACVLEERRARRMSL